MTTAIYPGSFDPLTFGHVDIVERSARLFDNVIVAILTNPQKAALFTVDERIEIMREILKPRFPNVEVDVFHGLLVDYAKDGRPLGIEITAPSQTSLGAINRLLRELGQRPMTRAELAPLRAA